MDLIKYPQKLAKMIDYTNVSRDATQTDIKRFCDGAKEHNFGCVCVTPAYVDLALDQMKGSDVKVCAVVGFPFGTNTSKIKFFEAKDVVESGVNEIDMVMNIGFLKSKLDEKVKEDINGVIIAAEGCTVKVIIETGLLTEEEKIRACKLIEETGANFVKTSAGFNTSGATVEDIILLKRTLRSDMGIKASGGIKDLQTALDMVEAGATRIGTSNGDKIMEELFQKYRLKNGN